MLDADILTKPWVEGVRDVPAGEDVSVGADQPAVGRPDACGLPAAAEDLFDPYAEAQVDGPPAEAGLSVEGGQDYPGHGLFAGRVRVHGER